MTLANRRQTCPEVRMILGQHLLKPTIQLPGTRDIRYLSRDNIRTAAACTDSFMSLYRFLQNDFTQDLATTRFG